ncbi:MAG TPA: hypothetical protein VGI90_05985 [Steroidobacteraceae bacterium]
MLGKDAGVKTGQDLRPPRIYGCLQSASLTGFCHPSADLDIGLLKFIVVQDAAGASHRKDAQEVSYAGALSCSR